MICLQCGAERFGDHCLGCDADPAPPPVPFTSTNLGGVAKTHAQREMEASRHMMVALKYLARQPCDRRNCGTVCLCGPCHARKALEFYEPDWRPR